MILVNNPGDWSHVYWPLLHARWRGWTPMDRIFPFFLFIMGVAMALSFKRREEGGACDQSGVLGQGPAAGCSWRPPYPASLAFALANVACWLPVAWFMYWRQWFVKI